MLFVAMAKARKTVVKIAAASTLGLVALTASPATANSAAADTFRVDAGTQVNRDITALGEADTNFRSLYSDWDSSAQAKPQSVAGFTEVAVPSLYPVDMQFARKSSGFGRRGAPVKGASRQHKGVDLAAPLGTPIYATADGMVTKSGWGSGYGKVVYVDHGNGIETRYGHMSGIAANYGDRVRKGDVIGYVGSTGRSSGNHLHYEVRVDGVAMNPSGFMNEARQSVSYASK